MSRHQAVRNLDYQAELDEYDGYSDEEDELSPEDRAAMTQGTIDVRATLGPASSKVTTAQIEEALWHYYYDVDKTVAYLVSKFVAPPPPSTKQQKASSSSNGKPLSFSCDYLSADVDDSREGSVVRDQANGAIYRIVAGHKCHFPNMEVYTAHGKPAFQDFQAGLVASIPDGPCILPPGFFEGQIVRNKSSGAIYKIVNGKKCHFSSMAVYTAHGKPAYTDFDPHLVTPIADGPAF